MPIFCTDVHLGEKYDGPCPKVNRAAPDSGAKSRVSIASPPHAVRSPVQRIFDQMPHLLAESPAATAAKLTLDGGDQAIVIAVGVVALIALAISFVLRAGVLATGTGTVKMQEISAAVQEGGAAYLGRQFRTLSIFVVIVFLLLFALPADDWNQRIGRSVFFLVGAGFSATIGYLGMWLATRANVRVAAAANGEGREQAMKIAFRTGGTVGLATTGLGLLGASIVVLVYTGGAPKVLEGFGFGAAMPAQSPTLSPTLSAMVAALRGSSSGMPCSTLPTRSAPTSAALVKMPPPTRMNIASMAAPKPKPSSTFGAPPV
jgi:K(+)-stimulated pyrophosphate-energized sodium pump